MFMFMVMEIPKARLLDNQLPPPQIWAPPAIVVNASSGSRYTHTSIETLVVVLAVITIVGVIAGILARLCGGRHLGAEHDIEGWVESKCRSCIDGGVPPEPSPAAPQSKPAAATEEAKK